MLRLRLNGNPVIAVVPMLLNISFHLTLKTFSLLLAFMQNSLSLPAIMNVVFSPSSSPTYSLGVHRLWHVLYCPQHADGI